jgi:aspartyl-tRNA(Asn)/glutamyl-tRNA(Gln) amidotransferase subunit B
LLHDTSITIEQCKISPQNLAKLVNLVASGDITDNIAKIVVDEMFQTGASPESIIDEKDLKPIQDIKILQEILEKAIAENREVVKQIKAGKINSINFIIGKVMSETGGKANPQKVRELVEKKLLF